MAGAASRPDLPFTLPETLRHRRQAVPCGKRPAAASGRIEQNLLKERHRHARGPPMFRLRPSPGTAPASTSQTLPEAPPRDASEGRISAAERAGISSRRRVEGELDGLVSGASFREQRRSAWISLGSGHIGGIARPVTHGMDDHFIGRSLAKRSSTDRDEPSCA